MPRKASKRPPRNVTKNSASPSRPNFDAVSAREYFKAAPRGTLNRAHVETGIGYATLQAHVSRGRPIMHKEIALKLQAWSKGAISAVKTLELE